MQLKEYQKRATDRFHRYLEKLNEAAEIERQIPENLRNKVPYDVPLEAWKALGLSAEKYHSWQNGLGEQTPLVCLKVPTGGGKTLLAAHALGDIATDYLHRQTGIALWIVPTTEIYRQTFRALRDKGHPYRQVLDLASGNHICLREKGDRITPANVKNELVILLLMLPSANRAEQETLKMFQANGDFATFFPRENDVEAQAELLHRFPNLDCFGSQAGETLNNLHPIVRPSLGNILRTLRPILILDEGHKTYSQTARNTIQGLNPCFVLELTATPRTEANMLVSISGTELNREEMIKLDLNVTYKASTDWHDTLSAGHLQLQELSKKAAEYQGEGGAYIRPICLIQVERTGKDQRDGRYIHAEDARDFLMTQCNVQPHEIAVKSSERDELSNVNLLSESCPVRYIITKQALQEGWDCPFAYVLVILPNNVSSSAVTQLIGRILRQPNARKTQVKLLDESYVFCYRESSKKVTDAIRKGFLQEGLDDLTQQIRLSDERRSGEGIDTIHYRSEFRHLEGKIYLPRFAVQEEQSWRDLSYVGDLLPNLDWARVDLDEFNTTLGTISPTDRTERLGLSGDMTVLKTDGVEDQPVQLTLDRTYLTRQLADIVPNPWIAWELVTRALNVFSDRPNTLVAAEVAFIVEQLKRTLHKQRNRLAAELFAQLLAEQKIFFFVQAVETYALPPILQAKLGTRRLVREDNSPTQRSLFDYYPDDQFNDPERSVAIYLDRQAELLFWYRNLVGQSGNFSIQGWENRLIYPDFVAARRDSNDHNDYSSIYVLETKGLHLKGNEDTEYKQNVFELCNREGKKLNWSELGAEFDGKKIEFKVVYEDEWRSELNRLFA